MDVCVDVVNHCRLLLLVNRSSRLHRVFLKRPRSLLNHLPYSLTLLDQRCNIDQLVSILHTRQKSDIVCKIFVGIIVVLITDVEFLCFHLKVTHAWSWYSFSSFFILVEFLELVLNLFDFTLALFVRFFQPFLQSNFISLSWREIVLLILLFVYRGLM